MSKLALKSRQLLLTVSDLEKKHKIITYVSLLFLTVSTYFLRSENQNVKIEFATLQERNLNLQKNMVLFNRSYEEFPLPLWQKVKRGNQFVMNYVNPEYIKKFGHHFNYDEFSILGKNNFQIFKDQPAIAQSYYEHDITVSVTGEKLESIEYSVDENGKRIKLVVVKWRDIKDHKDTLIYGMVKEFVKEKKIAKKIISQN
jgi:hypothetical protein